MTAAERLQEAREWLNVVHAHSKGTLRWLIEQAAALDTARQALAAAEKREAALREALEDVACSADDYRDWEPMRSIRDTASAALAATGQEGAGP